MAVYYHGSNAASFPGVFNKDHPGLRSLEAQLRDGNPPFCGEMYTQNKGISVTGKDCIAGAMRYVTGTFGGQYGWNPQQSKEIIEKKRIKLVRVLRGLRSNDYWSNKTRESIQRDYDFFVHVELLREKRWQELSEEDRELVRTPFPVLYGIFYDKRVEARKSDVPGDLVIREERIPLEDIIIFAPEFAVEKIKRRWKSIDLNPKTLPFIWLNSVVESIIPPRNKQEAEESLARLLAYKERE